MSPKQLFSTGAGAVLIPYSATCLYFGAVQTDKIFDPTPDILTTPDRMGMDYTRVSISMGEGTDRTDLDGFWVPAERSDAPTFLYLHGQDATIGKNLDHTLRLHQLGYNVLVFDYRGFGKSFGEDKPSEKSVYEDSEAAWDYLTQHLGIDPERVFIYGHSLGGAIAIELSVNHPEAAGLITECTFTSTLEMTKQRYRGALRFLPMDLILQHRFDSLKKVASLQIPVMLIHGTADRRVPAFMSEKLFQAAPEPKELLLIEGGEHSNSGSIGLVEYRDRVSSFVEKHLYQ